MTELGPRILFSLSPSRADPHPLDGATVSGRIYVFLEPAPSAIGVRYWSDDPFREDDSGRNERPPFDLLGSGTDGMAAPLDTTLESDGVHELAAELVF
ncbi:MAG TPA: hypothetical protein VKO35_01615, partial [Acidimicrobiia bacterium]|nr:hypothetical protein [Acidimicrobiia bacterium]